MELPITGVTIVYFCLRQNSNSVFPQDKNLDGVQLQPKNDQNTAIVNSFLMLLSADFIPTPTTGFNLRFHLPVCSGSLT